MLLHDVLDDAELGIRVLHGDPAMLERPVLRTCTTDMPDPTRYVSAGSLVFSGLVWRASAEDSDLFVKHLARVGVTALAAGEALLGEVPEDVVAACARHRLPLLSVPADVPFSRIIERMTARMSGARMDRLQNGLARQRRLLEAVADGRSIGDLLDRTAQEFGAQAWLLTATGVPLAGAAPLDDDIVNRLVAAALSAERLPHATADYTVLSVGGGLRDRTSCWLLVVRHTGDARADCLEAFRELATVAALDRVRRDERRRTAWDAGDSSGLVSTAAATFDSGRPLVAVVARRVSHDDRAAAATAERLRALRDTLCDALPGCVSALDGDRVVLTVAGDADEVHAVLRRRLARVVPALERTRLRVGTSATCTLGSLAGAVATATALATDDGDIREPVSVRTAAMDSAAELFSAVPDRLRHDFAQRILGPVLDHDLSTDSGLLSTLEVFLACSGSWRRTAERIHVHLNTVRYRIGKVEKLTGRDLSQIDDRLDVYLALRMLQVQEA